MQTNKTKAKLKDGQSVYGCIVNLPNASLVEILAREGWDFLLFDGEHGTLDPGDCEHMVRAAELCDVTPVVRATTNQPAVILRYLDTGAQGVHVPWVNTAAETESAIRSIKYQPRGVRGLAGVRASQYGKIPLGEYTQRANAETISVIHIETAEAAEQISEIAAVDDVDVIFVGPTDLSHSLGLPGQVDHPDVQAVIAQIVEAVRNAEPALGIYAGSAEAVQRWRSQGFQYFAIGFSALLRPAVQDYLQAVRA